MGENRRDFIRKLGLAGAGMALAGTSFISAQGKGNTTKVAIIGTGDRGRYLLRFYLQLINEGESISISALCDNYQTNLDKAASICKGLSNPPKLYNDYRSLLKECAVDGVIIATPLHQHAHIAIDSMKAGVHVLCEKAMARTLDGIKAMYDAHIQTGAILIPGHQRLFSNMYQNALERIHNNELGTIGQIRAYWHRNNNWRRPLPVGRPELERQINWRLYKEYSAGLLTELMSHHIQVANWVKQSEPVSVMGTGSIRYWDDGREVHDNIAAIFSYADGTQFTYDSMTSNRKYGLQVQVMGDKASMELETNRMFLENPPKPEPALGIAQLLGDIQKGTFNDIPVGGASWLPETANKYAGKAIYEGQKGDGTKEELLGFVNFIRNKENPNWMTKEGYMGSIWTILTEQAIDSGMKLSLPDKYKLNS